MGIAIPQVITPSKATGAQVIDGSLKFDSTKKTVLHRTFSAGNSRTWTFSMWTKKQNNDCHFLSSGTAANRLNAGWVQGSDKLFIYIAQSSSEVFNVNSVARFRDNGWYHIVIAADTTNANNDDRIIAYVNGDRIYDWTGNTTIDQNASTHFNNANSHAIGNRYYNNSDYVSGLIAQTYLIDGAALGPDSFGFTDPLTNTWKPKKYTDEVNFISGPTNFTNISTLAALANSTLDSSYNDVSKVFDGSGTGVRTVSEASGLGEKLSITFSPAITLDNETVSIDTSSTYQGMFVTVDGADGSRVSGSDSNVTTLTTGSLSGSLSKITVDNGTDSSGRPASILRIRIGGVTLLDPYGGVNGFYLPLDGNSPIGKDQSGNGNDFTPVNFGGSKSPDKATGAKPILNTLPGGAHATVGVFGSRENVGYAVTVYNDGGGNKYYIDGVKQDTVTGLIRGATYTFDTSDSTVSSHPFRFSATSNGSHGGGSEYTNGVAAITGAATTITVPHDAPNTLYYYCTSHSGMGADITGITTNEKLADQYASHATLALPLVGSSVDVCASIACTSTAKAITSNGTVAASSIESNFYSGSFLFDGDSDYFTFAPGADFAFGTGDFTVECWCYSKNRGTYDYIIDGRNSGQTTGTWTLAYGYAGGNGRLEFASGGVGGTLLECPAANNPEAGRWFHVAVARSGTSLKMFIDGVEVTSATNSTDFSTSPSTSYIGTRYSQQHYWDGYMQDIRVYKGVAKYTSDFTPASTNPDILPDSPSGVVGSSKLAKIQSTGGSVAFSGGSGGSDIKWTGTVSATHTLDYYIFASGNQSAGAGPVFLSDGTDGYQFDFSTGTDDLIRAEKAGGGSDTGYQRLNKGWNHVRLVSQTTSAAMYINGRAAGTFSPAGGVIGSATFYIGTKARLASSVWFRGFICNVRIIEAALTGTDTPVIDENGIIASSEGGTSAIFLWPGVNSLTENTGTSGDTITATADPVLTKFNPFTYTDIDIVRGQDTGENYCTINPLDNPGVSPYGNQGAVISNGNLDIAADGGSYAMRKGTIAVPSSGKWYYEATVNGTAASRSSSSQASGIGLIKSNVITDGNAPITDNHTLWLGDSGYGKPFGSGTRSSWSDQTIDKGDVISLALDMDANTFDFKVEGISVQSGDINTTEPVHPFVFSATTSNTNLTLNFGQKPFKFPPPEGYLPLNNVNTRPVKVISRPDQYVGVATYRGTGANQQINVGLKPDLVIIKGRDGDYDFVWQDTVRGLNKTITSNRTKEETTDNDGVLSVDVSGFVVGANTAGFQSDELNKSGKNYVTYCFKAGGNKNTFNVDGLGYASAAAAGLTGGDITPSGASVGTKQGFSIIKYAGSGTNGDTLPHGLLQTPDFIITKNLTDGNVDWIVKPVGLLTDDSYMLLLNSNTAQFQGTGGYISAQTSTLLTLTEGNNDGNYNNSGDNYVMYAWHSIPGLQKFGSYTGNNDADGPFVELGFRPAVLWVKRRGATGSWYALDIERDKFNNTFRTLSPNQYAQEDSTTGASGYCDFLSNGFKARIADGSINASDTYIYAAWATAPSIDLYGGGANAR